VASPVDLCPACHLFDIRSRRSLSKIRASTGHAGPAGGSLRPFCLLVCPSEVKQILRMAGLCPNCRRPPAHHLDSKPHGRNRQLFLLAVFPGNPDVEHFARTPWRVCGRHRQFTDPFRAYGSWLFRRHSHDDGALAGSDIVTIHHQSQHIRVLLGGISFQLSCRELEKDRCRAREVRGSGYVPASLQRSTY